jgi:hypothetical protein
MLQHVVGFFEVPQSLPKSTGSNEVGPPCSYEYLGTVQVKNTTYLLSHCRGGEIRERLRIPKRLGISNPAGSIKKKKDEQMRINKKDAGCTRL